MIEKLKLKDFGGYKQADIEFKPGLNLIVGRNSTGKTTILDAILFALFGESDFDKSLLISRRNGGEMRVYLKFKSPVSNSEVEIFRSARLAQDGRFDTKDRIIQINNQRQRVGEEELKRKVMELLGISLRKFETLIYVRQGQLRSILYPKKEDMDMILGITVLEEVGKELDEARKRLERFEGKDVRTELTYLKEKVIPQLENSYFMLSQDVKSLNHEVNELRDVIRKGESLELESLIELIELRDKEQELICNIKNSIKTLLESNGFESFEILLEAISEKAKEIERVRKEVAEKDSKLREIQTRFVQISSEVRAIKKEVDKHRELISKGYAKCPTCGQELDPERIKPVIEEDEKKLEEKRKEEEEIRKQYEQIYGELLSLTSKENELSGKVKELNRIKYELEGKEKEKEERERKLDEILNKISEILTKLSLEFNADDQDLKANIAQKLPISREELERKRKELFVKENELRRKENELEKVEEQLKNENGKLRILERNLELAKFAKRLSEKVAQAIEHIRKERLRNIGYKALSIYNRLTDQQLYSAIEIDPETYRVYVLRKDLNEKMPTRRIGGGHETLVALAVRLAILEELGYREFLVLDEPTDGVDSENLPQLISHIGEASRHVKQLILVTHHGLGEEYASNMIKVDLAKDGSSITRSIIG